MTPARTSSSPASACAARAFAALSDERRSWLGWTGEPLARDAIEQLVRLAHQSPSECNTQPWRFAVAQGAALERLLPVFLASNRDKLREAGTAVVVLGDLAAIDADPKASAFYSVSPFTPRDFAMRNASLAAMSFMLAATAHGYGARPMVGFDPHALIAETGLPPEWLPVMCIAVGHPDAPRHAPRDRAPLDGVVTFL
ncbi:MAG TPA: nitroreductase family protein [Conexibacter sp.]|nr:nitroreductase family protein [Conexibacter sp.]